MPTYPGDPGIVFEQWTALANGDPANVTMLHFGAHTGTHVDAPSHFIADAKGVDDILLSTLVGPARVVRIADDVMAITSRHVALINPIGATRLLFKTRNSAFWANQNGFRTDFTFIAPDAARALVEMGVKLVGIDYLSVEEFGSTSFATHNVLLASGVVILEGLDLRGIDAGDFELICLPLKLVDGTRDGAPARAVLRTID